MDSLIRFTHRATPDFIPRPVTLVLDAMPFTESTHTLHPHQALQTTPQLPLNMKVINFLLEKAAIFSQTDIRRRHPGSDSPPREISV
jgi:hypothetical protein